MSFYYTEKLDDTHLSLSVAKHYKPFLFSYQSQRPLLSSHPPHSPSGGQDLCHPLSAINWLVCLKQIPSSDSVLVKVGKQWPPDEKVFLVVTILNSASNESSTSSISCNIFHFPEVLLLHLIWCLATIVTLWHLHCTGAKTVPQYRGIKTNSSSYLDIYINTSVKNVLTGLEQRW